MARGGRGEKSKTKQRPIWQHSDTYWWTPKSSTASNTVKDGSPSIHRRVPLRPTELLQGMQTRASGDGAASANAQRHCRLCGAERGLRRITDRCPWEGGRCTIDQILTEIFGVMVPEDCMICFRCVAQLRSSQKFRTVVLSSFRVWSECTSYETTDECETTSFRTLKNPATRSISKMSVLQQTIISETGNKSSNKKILEYLAKKVGNTKKERLRKQSMMNSSISVPKRTIMACNACGQRYPMIASADTPTANEFICSRCKLKRYKSVCRRCNTTVQGSMRDHLAEHSKGDAKKSAVFRQRLTSNTTTQLKKPRAYTSETSTIRPNDSSMIIQCSYCPRTYSQPKQLADHVKRCHTEFMKCHICKSQFSTKNLLDQHMQLHSGEALYECDICKRVFKGKESLRLHYLTHENFR